MKTQVIIAASALLLLVAAMPPFLTAKDATVTLEITGMT